MIVSNENMRLEEVCFELARTTKWERRPIDIDEVRALANRFLEVAKERASRGVELGVDVSLVTRAVSYLGQAHAMPLMGNDTQWFSNMLDAVLEIARPNSGLSGEAREFLRDLLYGIGTFINDCEQA